MNFDFLEGKTNEEIKKYIDNKIENIGLYLAEKGNLELVKYLVEHGANVNDIVGFNYGKTVLFSACESGNIEIAKYLVDGY